MNAPWIKNYMINEKDIKDYKDDKWTQPGDTWTVTLPQGTKYDQGKPPMALLDSEYLEGLARVLGFGASKYAAHNWRAGIQYSRLISAAMRHLSAINGGEDLDPETGELHAYHLGCCTMFLAAMMNLRPDMDDRWRPS